MTSLDDPQLETILAVGTEGGSVTIKGRRVDGGIWAFSVHTNNMWFNDPDIGGPAPKTYGPVVTWEEALNLFSEVEPRWLWYHVAHVHREFRPQVNQEITRRYEQMSVDEREHWGKRYSRQWRNTLVGPASTPDPAVLKRIHIPDISRWTRCSVEYIRWGSMSGESSRDINLAVYQHDKFETIAKVWQADARDKPEECLLALQQVIKKLGESHWKIVDKTEGEESSDTGWSSWKKYTLERDNTDATAARLREFE